MSARPIVSTPGSGEIVRNPQGGSMNFIARGEQTGGALNLFENTAQPGEGPPLHIHVKEDELMFVVEGCLRFELDSAFHTAPAGSFVFIPRGVPHAWLNVGDEPARFFFLFTPAAPGMERFFERAAELPPEANAAAAFKQLSADAGVEVLGPPLGNSGTSGARQRSNQPEVEDAGVGEPGEPGDRRLRVR